MGAIALFGKAEEGDVEAWRLWFFADATGIIGLAPAVLSLPSFLNEEVPRRRHLEGVALLTGLAACAAMLFSVPADAGTVWAHIPPLAALFPILLMIAIRLPLGYAAIAVTIVTMLVVFTTASELGRFSDSSLPISVELFSAQMVIVSAAICSLTLAAIVAERNAAEGRQRMLISELDHRVKNSLSLMQAVVERSQQSAKSMDDFFVSLKGRIGSLARTQTKLSRGQWRGVSLTDLIENELTPYRTPGGGFVTGPPVNLKPSCAQSLSMVVHELATNAAKYGAFSVPHGEVYVSWHLEGQAGEMRGVVIEWREAGGPLVEAPGHEGFGTSTIRDLLPFEQSGVVTLNFEPRGVICRIALPAGCLAEWKPADNSPSEPV